MEIRQLPWAIWIDNLLEMANLLENSDYALINTELNTYLEKKIIKTKSRALPIDPATQNMQY